LLGLKALNHIYYPKIPYITTWWALYMVANGFDDPNRSIYHVRTLTLAFVEFRGCLLGLKALRPYILP
jgi:hypothetical protein